MKKIYIITFLAASFICQTLSASINYTFTAVAGTYSANSGGIAIAELYSGGDQIVSAAYPIGFTFNFDDAVYTEFKVSDNGCLFFGTVAVSGDPASGDEIMPNDLSAPNTDRPFAAPLWDDLAISGSVTYLLSGNSPNRVLTVEWNNMDWKYNVAQYGGGHSNVSFQVKLYETTDVIEFVYNPESGALATCPSLGCGSASIGLEGTSAGDYYSLDDISAAPLASQSVNTMDIYTKPVPGQIYRWSPDVTGIISVSINTSIQKVYPNPVYDNAHIIFQSDENNTSIRVDIFDMIGQKLLSKNFPSAKGENNMNIDVSSLDKGIYMICINNSRSVKFIKE